MGSISRDQLVATVGVLNVTVATAKANGFISVQVSYIWVANSRSIGYA